MVTNTFFDLQRFADDVLVGGESGFAWEGGHSFAGSGTENDPAQMVAAGTSGAVASIAGTAIYLKGTEEGYSFTTAYTKDDWEIAIKGESNIVSGDNDSDDGDYELTGTIDIKVIAGKEGFVETVNDSDVYLKANTEDTTVNVTAVDATDSMLYTFADDVKGVEVGLEDGDAANFEGKGTDVVFRAGAGSDAKVFQPLDFEKGIVAVSDGEESISIYSGDNTFTDTNGQKLIATAATSAPFVLSSDGDQFQITGVKDVIAEGGLQDFSINGKVWTATGAGVSSAMFNDHGAHVDVKDTGVASVEGEEGSFVGFDSLTTDGVTANGAKIQAVDEAMSSFAVKLDSVDSGIKGIAFDTEDGFVKVTGDDSFEVRNGGASYILSTDANSVTFDAINNDNLAVVIVDDNRAYTLDGADGIYAFANSIRSGATGNVGINGADVQITNNQDEIAAPAITSDADKEGVDVITGVKANDVVNVENDADGYTVIFDAAEGDEGDVALVANDAVVSLDAAKMNESDVTMSVSSDGTEVSIKGVEGNSIITVSGGASGITYQITNDKASNEVFVAAGKGMVVELDSKKNVVDVYSTDLADKIAKNQAKWDEISTIGGANDDDLTHRGAAQDQFYDLSGVSATLLGYTYDDDPLPTEEVASVVNIAGNTSLEDAAHVTMSAGSGDFAGAVPVNIQKNENDNVVDVTVDMSNAKYPSTVAVGTEGEVTASHKIYLSNSGSSNNPNYAYIGEYATGQNLVQAGNGAAMLRHDGDNRTSVLGGSGNDTILPDKNDVVYGNGGADLFYDDASYDVKDYNVTEGDAIVATRVDSLEDVAYDNVSGKGNQVQIGNAQVLTLANLKDDETVHIKVATLDEDGDISSARRDVVLANSEVAVDATEAGTNGALIIADMTRGNQANFITGSAGDDEIYVGANDSVVGGEGDDDITIYDGGTGVVVGLSDNSGDDTVKGWRFGFDRNAGDTKLYLGGANFEATTIERSLVVTTDDDSSMTIALTEILPWYPILVDDKKYMVITSGSTATIDSNDLLADTYFAEAEGTLIFTSNVTDDLGLIVIGDGEDYENIRSFGLFNNSTASIVGTAERENVSLGGDASISAGKAVSLAGGNDVIVSSGDEGASNVFFFSAGDGRDTIHGFGHYLGVEKDPDKQKADVLVIEDFTGMQVAHYEDGDRIVFNTSENDDVVIYEENGLDINNKMYLVKVGDADVGVAKLGYTESLTSGVTGNVFTYSKEVNYFIGSNVEARDTLVVGDDVENVEIWLDGTAEEDKQFYRGIGVIDASAATETDISLIGSMDDNTIIGGGIDTNNVLWGGAGDNLLVGGEGEDIFVYAKDSRDYIDGAEALDEANHDVIANYDADNDTIFLGDITLDDIDLEAMASREDGGITEDSVTVQFKNGGTLTVAGTQEETRFNLADGTTYTATRSTNSWS